MLDERVEDARGIELSACGLHGAGTRPVVQRAEAAAAVAGEHAVAVDREGRFPAEALAALKAQRLLGMAVPRAFGGDGASLGEVADVCFRLGRRCSSTALIFAMHQIKLACVVRHAGGAPFHEGVLRSVAAHQWLLASSTTEGLSGGNVRSSAAAIEAAEDGTVSLDRDSTVISYGAQADAIVTTARRSAEAAGSDQVLVVLLREHYRLDPGQAWDTLGMRGTCSRGFKLHARAAAGQVLPVGYDVIHARTITPVAHVLWGAVWSGIAAAAVERAQAFLRAAARRAKGQMPPGAAHYTRAQSSLRGLRLMVRDGVERCEAAFADEAHFNGFEFAVAMNLLKVEASDTAVAAVTSALRACGLSGYRNDGDSSIGRQLRDVLSAPLMINNDRILSSLASPALMAPVPAGLAD
ncbi:acyl-CoA dehydrogenase [Lichenibacterium minor]|uniref:Acyl-CoA dehydrogenase n=1 Tax=Lichenibacterium minor TaxID=2316528 RepID=A0A4Q2U961_9HYPH|nr:acyl-CoA dehydrogenase family protein [Lichenibacterium minor]RYC31637.1 acyl-CoA dehydrogenase [Lichenibacterium minor]